MPSQPLTPEQQKAKQERMQAKVGLASNALGLTAGTAGLVTAAKNPALRQKFKRTGEEHIKPPMEPKEVGGPVTRRLAHKLKSPKARGKLIAAGAAGAAGLQALNIGGDVVANRVMSRAAGGPESKSGKPVKKSWDQGISKGWDGGDRVPGYGQNLISKKAYMSRREREDDRQQRARVEGVGLQAAALPTAAAGAGAIYHGYKHPEWRPHIPKKSGALQMGYPSTKGRGFRLPKRYGAGAALLGAAPLMVAGGRRIQQGARDEWT